MMDSGVLGAAADGRKQTEGEERKRSAPWNVTVREAGVGVHSGLR